MVRENEDNPKALCNAIKKILHGSPKIVLRDHILLSHIAHKNISNINQSVYRAFHITKTALLNIQNDIATSMDKGIAFGLVFLDFSAALDTTDHSILFDCLQHFYGIEAVVFKWVH